jgi:hypothetical protein
MRRVLLILLVLFGPANLLASPIGSTSSAVLDWSNYGFTVEGGLVIFRIDSAGLLNYATATTSGGGTSQFGGFDGGPAFADFGYSNNIGHATASASSVNGLLRSYTEAGADDTSYFSAHSGTSTVNDFWLYGIGTGTLTATLPYRLTADCSPAAFNELSSAAASVSLSSWSGSPGGYDSAQIGCGESPKVGTLTVSQSFNNPTFGPLTSFTASAGSDVVASIPESGSSSVLFAIGLLGIGLMPRLTRHARRHSGRIGFD